MTTSAKIIADSISPDGVRIITYELEYWRAIHAEFMTHRMWSKNAASSRAIPVKRAIEMILSDTAKPSHWGKNQPGMSAKEECDAVMFADSEFAGHDREEWWDEARDAAILHAEEYDKAGYHKQIVNRLLEPFAHIKVVATATCDDNLFWLRRHVDAQPEFQELANCMWDAKQSSNPLLLRPGEWHVPYYQDGHWTKISSDPLEDAIAVSSSCCAQVSYRKTDDSIEKARNIYARLVESTPVHASPFEHQATPINMAEFEDGFAHDDLPLGVTAIGVSRGSEPWVLWSGNFCGWIQNRQLIPGNVCNNYTP